MVGDETQGPDPSLDGRLLDRGKDHVVLPSEATGDHKFDVMGQSIRSNGDLESLDKSNVVLTWFDCAKRENERPSSQAVSPRRTIDLLGFSRSKISLRCVRTHDDPMRRNAADPHDLVSRRV